MNDVKPKQLTLSRLATYQIKVPGHLDERWGNWNDEIKVVIENDENGLPISVLTGTIDQATLQGLLRSLYSLGLPLISLNCLKVE